MGKKVISFVGHKGSGKTTLLERVIPILKEYGLRIAVIKHDAHQFEVDYPGKDSYRLREAGGDVVSLVSDTQYVQVERVKKPLSFDEILTRVGTADLYLTEGFKQLEFPKIEVFRQVEPDRRPLVQSGIANIVAVATDVADLAVTVPRLDLNDPVSIASFVLNFFHFTKGSMREQDADSGDTNQ